MRACSTRFILHTSPRAKPCKSCWSSGGAIQTDHTRGATMSHKLAASAVLAAAILTLGGCNDPVRAPYSPNRDLVTKDTYRQITADGDLAGWLLYAKPSLSHEGNILRVSVPVRLT